MAVSDYFVGVCAREYRNNTVGYVPVIGVYWKADKFSNRVAATSIKEKVVSYN
jgi:hypothetical protein